MSNNGNDELINTALLASKKTLENFSDDVQHLWCPQSIPILEQPPLPMSFLRDYVSKSTPCIIRNSIMNHDNFNLSLTLDDLVNVCKADCREDLMLTVDVTPDGHGDVVRTVLQDGETQKRMFVKPQEKQMTLSEFRNGLRIQSRRGCHNPVEIDESGKAIFPLETLDEGDAASSSFCDSDKVLYYSRQVRKDSITGNGNIYCLFSTYWRQLLNAALHHSRYSHLCVVAPERLFTNRTPPLV